MPTESHSREVAGPVFVGMTNAQDQDMTPYALAKKLNVPRTRIERIVAGKTGITSDTALRLAKFFKTAPQFWMNLQNSFDLKVEAKRLGDELELIKEYQSAA